MIQQYEFWIATVIAALALLLSIMNFITQRRDKRPRLLVHPSMQRVGLPLASDSGFPTQDAPAMVVHIANPSENPINVKKVELRLPGEQTIQLFQHNALYQDYWRPFAVSPWNGHNIHVLGERLAAQIREVTESRRVRSIVVVHDELGNTYQSNNFDIGLDKFHEQQPSS